MIYTIKITNNKRELISHNSRIPSVSIHNNSLVVHSTKGDVLYDITGIISIRIEETF